MTDILDTLKLMFREQNRKIENLGERAQKALMDGVKSLVDSHQSSQRKHKKLNTAFFENSAS